MTLWNAIVVGLKEIWAHKFRSALTMLGIVLGVSSLVTMSALVQGMENGAREALVAVGGLEKIRVEAQPVPVEQRHLRDFATGVTLDDVRALEHSAPDISKVSPELRFDSPPTLAADGKTHRTWMTAGVWPIQAQLMEHTIEHGRMFTDLDNEMARNVCVIGTGIRDELFGKPEDTGEPVVPIGRSLTINGYPFTIVGMFTHYESEQDRRSRELREKERLERIASGKTNEPAGGAKRDRGWSGRRSNFAFWIKNNTVYVPLNTLWMKMKSGQSNAPPVPKLSSMEIKLRDSSRINEALTQVRNVLMVTHRGIEDFSFRTQEDRAEEIDTFIRNARVSGGLVAGISLLVGGIGIMNIMLASISERIREIGIRKAVGAGDGAVFIQIVIESTVIAVVGGLLGLATSFGFIRLITILTPTDNAPVVTAAAMALAFSASAGIGVLAGLLPALRAARMNVIQSLRYD
ncbi:MAG: ABC transporter permease [Verrucomicrobiales bacterium]|nr:ABC transporter permease [Verrucomicrobiales bacterium]